MYRKRAFPVEFPHAVYAVSGDVHYPASYLRPYRHGNRLESIGHVHASLEPVRTVHRHGSHRIFADVLLNFQNKVFPVFPLDDQCVMDARKLSDYIFARQVEMHVDHGSDYL